MFAMIKCAALLLAVLGYSMFYQRRRLPLCFFPVTLISGIGLVLYIAGFFGLLRETSYGIVLLGCAALLCWGNKEKIKAVFTDRSLVFFVFAAIWMYGITRGVMLSHYDDGTHWYRICKVLCYEHAYPTTPDIFFNEYVPGCALWVYFVARFIGFTIPNAMFAQNLLNVAAITTMFCAVPKEKGVWWKGFSFVLVSLAGVLLCSLTVSTYTLLVDVQVGLYALAALIFVHEHGKQKEALVPITLVFGFLALIKASALFFIVLILFWTWTWHRFKMHEGIVRFCSWSVLPVMLYSAYAFRSRLSGYQSNHSVSLKGYISVFGDKNLEEIGHVTKRFFYAMLPGQVEGGIAVYTTLILLILLYVCFKAENQCISKLRRYGVRIAVSIAVYILSLYAMYLCAMSYEEAIKLNGLYRYYGTGAILAVGITIYAVLKLSCDMGYSKVYLLSMLLLFVLLTPGAFSKKYILGADHYHIKEDMRSDIWSAMELYIPENKQYSDSSYAVLWNEDDFFGGSRDNGRVSFIAGAWLRASDIQVLSEWDLRAGVDQEKLESLRSCDYLACISDMSVHSDVFNQIWGETELTPGLREIVGSK